jgi:erythromycin esterase-like protein
MMETVRTAANAELSDLIAEHSLPLPASHPYDTLAEALDEFSEARVVLLGECTHGTSEFYKARAAITRRLVDQHGLPDCCHRGRLAGCG